MASLYDIIVQNRGGVKENKPSEIETQKPSIISGSLSNSL